MRPRTPKRIIGVAIWICMLCPPALAEEKRFVLDADPVLVESGLIKHLVPRFSMKMSIRIAVEDGAGDEAARLSDTASAGARPVIASGDTIWYLAVPEGNPHAARFRDWLTSDVGQRTIASFAPDNHPPFAPPAEAAPATRQIDTGRDTTEGVSLSLVHCGRCHVIGPQNKHNSIGSTPSFSVLRGLANWQERFETFYVLNPHPAFTQIDDVTAPFDPERPSPIYPVEMSLDDLDEILTYVASIAPADLGAPIQHQ